MAHFVGFNLFVLRGRFTLKDKEMMFYQWSGKTIITQRIIILIFTTLKLFSGNRLSLTGRPPIVKEMSTRTHFKLDISAIIYKLKSVRDSIYKFVKVKENDIISIIIKVIVSSI